VVVFDFKQGNLLAAFLREHTTFENYFQIYEKSLASLSATFITAECRDSNPSI